MAANFLLRTLPTANLAVMFSVGQRICKLLTFNLNFQQFKEGRSKDLEGKKPGEETYAGFEDTREVHGSVCKP